jgi:hypothetical protein
MTNPALINAEVAIAEKGREARRRFERTMARRYRRDRVSLFLPHVRPQFLEDDPAVTRALIRALGHKLHALLRGRRGGEFWAVGIPPIYIQSLRAALFGEILILKRQLGARAHEANLKGLQGLLDELQRAPGMTGGRAA